MLVFSLKPFTGHIKTCAEEAVKIAKAHPEHQFYLEFNGMTICASDREPHEVVEQYNRRHESVFLL